MTELETQLLSALEQLQQDYGQRLTEWENAFEALQRMYERTSAENQQLTGRVEQLSTLVNGLSTQVQQFADLYRQNGR
ncbi:MbeD family mobilization/exclusion protein [Serratia marcescens]|uniref:Mobilization protein n=2 Tax=Serratia TaxID=613 RepID=A0A2F0P2S4_SERMA|nr:MULTISPECIES: MbeD family mobilization/exclusion protein [Gammaproteobacteria]EKT9260374.1 MbeD family mobilization/exclusion protein [Klebsiella pneumoniae]HBE9083065.1 MbeD family mobilization/exclusion protein [Serratia fonticola]MBX9279946.1 MbeD family mobilization/exclusion protein [Serratia marcescens]MBX9284960.1 MbeD family mobilization/exclusion protein [Serratia marcescens]MBX9289974.1 MbeD family mobilization/exclusion protein [Serratia marcescens]